MRWSQRIKLIAQIGIDAVHDLEREKKRIRRARNRAKGLNADGKPYTVMYRKDGSSFTYQPKGKTPGHPVGCLCYDCLWGHGEEPHG